MKLENINILLNQDYASNKLIGSLNPTELFEAIRDGKYDVIPDKAKKPVISQSFKDHRPQNNVESYLHWNGLHPVDVDIKHKTVAPIAKKILEKLLYKYHWVHSIALSTSKNGLHIYTYTEPFSAPDSDIISQTMAREYYMDVYEYKMMVMWKAMYICYDALLALGVDQSIARKVHPMLTDNVDSTGKKLEVLDVSTVRISQPLIVTSDPTIKLNEIFELDTTVLPEVLTIYDNVDKKYGMEYLKNQFNRIRNRRAVEIVDGIAQYSDNHEFDDSFKDKIIFEEGEMETLYQSAQPMHYDNQQRYRMAYTLAYLFNIKENGDRYNQVEAIFMKILSGNPKYKRESRQWRNAFKSAVDRNKNNNCPCIWSAVQELKNIHKFDITINIDRKEANEAIASVNTDDAIYNHILTPVVYNDFFKLNPTHVFKIKNDEYIGTYQRELVNIIKHGVNMLNAPPGFGKTELIKGLSKDARVMLVLPYTSIISSKIENSDLGFDCFYGDRPLTLGNAKNVAMTYDKFTRIDVDEVSMMFDYVAIDESHLLTMSSYRDTVPADVVNKVNDLKTKVLLMTGTNVSEHLFMKLETVIEFSRPLTTRNKNMNFVICQSNGDKLTKIAIHIANALKDGKKILFPTNKGNEYQERITASARAFYGGKVTSKYYKKENEMDQFVDNINNKGTVGEVDVLFCSNFLSVGVDINDTTKFDVIYDEHFTAQEIEQFNCRLRKLDIESYFYFSKMDSQNNPKNITQYEDLSLELTTDEVLSFSDIKKLYLQTNPTDSGLFDFFKYAFTLPYLSQDRVSGEIHVHSMCYRLHKFEEKWREWAIQLNVVATFLGQYGYICDVIQDMSETDESIKIALSASKEAASEYKALRNSHTAQFLKICNDDKIFNFVMDVRNEHIVDSDKFEVVKRKGVPIFLIADRNIFDTWRRVFRVLSRYYIRETIFDIIELFCYDKETYNISASNRLIDALRVIENTEDDNLVDSNIYIVDKIVNGMFEGSLETTLEMDKDEIDYHCIQIANMYIKHSAEFAESFHFKLKIEQLAQRIFKALVIKSGKSNYSLVRIPAFDSPTALQRNRSLSVIMSLFGDDAGKIEANISRNEMGRTLAEGMKELMNADSYDEQSDHVILDNSKLMSMHESLTNEILDDIRDIDDTDYKFIKAIKDTQEKADELKGVFESLESSQVFDSEMDDILNKALDELL